MSGYIDPFWDENRAERADDELRLEQDILAPLSQSKRLFVYETKDFWRQIKSAGYPKSFHLMCLTIVVPLSPQTRCICNKHFNLLPPVH